MSTHIVAVRHHLYQQSLFFQILNYKFSCLISVKSVILTSRHINSCIIMHYIDLSKIMSFTYLKIIRIMCRCYLYTACSKLLINIFICNYRYLSSYQWQNKFFTYNVLISFIKRVNSNRSISQKSLRSCCGNFYKLSFFSRNRILYMPEIAVHLYMLHLGIRNRCLTYRTPVYYPVSLIDISLLI